MNEGRWIDANGTRFLLDKSRGESRKLFQDPLTATYSRRYFETYLTHMEGMECVEIIDVNQFKQVNDTYGHEAGDMTLVCIANIFEAICRKYKVIRWGGEEFLIVLFDVTADEAYRLSEQIRTDVEHFKIVHEDQEFFWPPSISGRRRD